MKSTNYMKIQLKALNYLKLQQTLKYQFELETLQIKFLWINHVWINHAF